MDAPEIIKHLMAGKLVTLRAQDAWVFMRECEAHDLITPSIAISFNGKWATLRLEADKQAMAYCAQPRV